MIDVVYKKSSLRKMKRHSIVSYERVPVTRSCAKNLLRRHPCTSHETRESYLLPSPALRRASASPEFAGAGGVSTWTGRVLSRASTTEP